MMIGRSGWISRWLVVVGGNSERACFNIYRCIYKYIYMSDISFKKTFCLMNIRPQDFLSHDPTLWFRRH